MPSSSIAGSPFVFSRDGRPVASAPLALLEWAPLTSTLDRMGNRVKLLVVLLVVAAVSACTALAAPSQMPEWLQVKVGELERLPRGQSPREIVRTSYAGRAVYYISPRCCDIPSELYEESGQLICYPDGGFAGGDGRCPSFALPPNSVTVWRATESSPANAAASGVK
jgi:hypothetical protein